MFAMSCYRAARYTKALKEGTQKGSRKSMSTECHVGTDKSMTARNVTGFYAFLLRPEIGQFSPHLGPISLLNYTVNLKKREKIHWRKLKKKSSGDGAPKLQIFVPCRGRTRPDHVGQDRVHTKGVVR